MTRVIAYTQELTPRAFELPYFDDIPVSVNMLIADIRTPDKTNASFTKTWKIPGTPEANEFFEFAFKVNTNKLRFNPNKKSLVVIYVQDVEYFRGDLQLVKINYNEESDYVESYEVTMVGRNGNFFLSLSNKTFADLNFSEYNHVLSKTNVINSWATSIIQGTLGGFPVTVPFQLGNGYVYGLVDYGYNTATPFTEFQVKHFRPQIYKKTILDKIFNLVGYRYDSTIFNSPEYKREVIPFNLEQLNQTAQAIATETFLASSNANQLFTANLLPIIDINNQPAWALSNGGGVVMFNDDFNPPNNDVGNSFSNITGVFTVGVTQDFDIFAEIRMNVNLISSTANLLQLSNITVHLERFVSGSWSSWISAQMNPINTLPTPVNNVTFIQNLGFQNTPLVAGGQYRVTLRTLGANVSVLNGNTIITTGAHSININIVNGSVFYARPSSPVILEGAFVDMNKIIDPTIKLSDWILSEFKLHNIYMEQDKTDDRLIILEDREGFYNGDVLNWTNKHDHAIKTSIKPMGELSFKRYEYAFKTDVDDFNKQYFDEYKEVYGSHFVNVDNDFINQTSKTEVIYAATPVVGNSINSLITPRLYKLENGQPKPTKTLPRSLYYGGLKQMTSGTWTLKSSSGDQVFNSYPYVGDSDDPINPTLTMNWGIPRKVFYYKPQATYTDNTLYNRYYSRQINQITDPNSLIVEKYYALTPVDILNFSFRNIIFDKEAYYLVNKIQNIDPLRYQSVQVELLKLVDYAPFTPAVVVPPDTQPGFTNRTYNGGQYVDEYNNANYGENCRIIGGRNNFIPPGAKDVILINQEDVIVDNNSNGTTIQD